MSISEKRRRTCRMGLRTCACRSCSTGYVCVCDRERDREGVCVCIASVCVYVHTHTHTHTHCRSGSTGYARLPTSKRPTAARRSSSGAWSSTKTTGNYFWHRKLLFTYAIVIYSCSTKTTGTFPRPARATGKNLPAGNNFSKGLSIVTFW